MSQEHIFVDGLIFKPKHEKAPSFIKGSLSIKVEEFQQFMDKYQKGGWLNIDLKESSGGKFYAALNTWEPNNEQQSQQSDNIPEPIPVTQREEEINVSDIPF